MTKVELLKRLENVSDDTQIMILDSFNGQGSPREINLFSNHIITDKDSNESDDCDGLEGEKVIVIGYGCY